jgi:hypothetical protein
MAIQTSWTDFIILPNEIGGIQTYQERVNVARAVDTSTNGWDAHLHAALITEDKVTQPNDLFEAMEISERGDVMIWTTKRIWYIRRECNAKERLRFVPRHPEYA